MKNISFDKNILYIGDKNIVFEDEIFQVKIEDDKIYVLLDIKPKEKLTYDDCNNVFCYSGKISCAMITFDSSGAIFVA